VVYPGETLVLNAKLNSLSTPYVTAMASHPPTSTQVRAGGAEAGQAEAGGREDRRDPGLRWARQALLLLLAAAVALRVRHLDVVLRVHGHELADGHAARAGHVPRQARHQHRPRALVHGAHADHERRHGDQPVVRAEDRGAEPLRAGHVVGIDVTVGLTSPCFFDLEAAESWEASGEAGWTTELRMLGAMDMNSEAPNYKLSLQMRVWVAHARGRRYLYGETRVPFRIRTSPVVVDRGPSQGRELQKWWERRISTFLTRMHEWRLGWDVDASSCKELHRIKKASPAASARAFTSLGNRCFSARCGGRPHGSWAGACHRRRHAQSPS
jgi:hypothetical protein